MRSRARKSVANRVSRANNQPWTHRVSAHRGSSYTVRPTNRLCSSSSDRRSIEKSIAKIGVVPDRSIGLSPRDLTLVAAESGAVARTRPALHLERVPLAHFVETRVVVGSSSRDLRPPARSLAPYRLRALATSVARRAYLRVRARGKNSPPRSRENCSGMSQ